MLIVLSGMVGMRGYTDTETRTHTNTHTRTRTRKPQPRRQPMFSLAHQARAGLIKHAKARVVHAHARSGPVACARNGDCFPAGLSSTLAGPMQATSTRAISLTASKIDYTSCGLAAAGATCSKMLPAWVFPRIPPAFASHVAWFARKRVPVYGKSNSKQGAMQANAQRDVRECVHIK